MIRHCFLPKGICGETEGMERFRTQMRTEQRVRVGTLSGVQGTAVRIGEQDLAFRFVIAVEEGGDTHGEREERNE